jgi:uncharacterized Zn finger protein (UPF0148 family)
MSKDSENIKKMADQLRQGSTLTGLSCPACFSPLFKIKNKGLWCVSCQKPVKIAKEGENEAQTQETPVSSTLETTLLTKIQGLEKQLVEETDPEKLGTIGTSLSILLENLEKIQKMKKPT